MHVQAESSPTQSEVINPSKLRPRSKWVEDSDEDETNTKSLIKSVKIMLIVLSALLLKLLGSVIDVHDSITLDSCQI